MLILKVIHDHEFGYLYNGDALVSTHKFTDYRKSGNEVKFYINGHFTGRVVADVVKIMDVDDVIVIDDMED
jgi:hypothetical protein